MKARIGWSNEAQARLRAIDRPDAMVILRAVARFATTGEGDIKALKGPLAGTRRLRVGDYRVRFSGVPEQGITILSVKHRSEAYR